VRHAFPVGKTASREDACALESVEKLAREPTLAHARLAVDREEMRAAVAGDAREGVLEKLELCVPADERGPRAEWTSRAVDGVDETPRTRRSIEALQLERAGVLDHQAGGGEAVRRRSEEDLPGRRDLLQAS